MFCENCGATIADDSKFCTACGATVNSNIAVQPNALGSSAQDTLSAGANSSVSHKVEYTPSANSIDYYNLLNALYEVPNPNNKQLLQMAWFLVYFRYVSVNEPQTPKDEECILGMTHAWFCNFEKVSVIDEELKGTSRLYQMYKRSLWKIPLAWRLIDKETASKALSNKYCSRCKGCGSTEHAVCPYTIAITAIDISNKKGIPVRDIFKRLLGKDFIDFKDGENINTSYFSQADYLGIDSVCATAAEILIQGKLIEIDKIEGSDVYFRYVELANIANQGSVMENMLDFWNSKSGVSKKINVITFLDNIPNPDKYTDENFTQCPYSVAAYILYFAQSKGLDPITLAHYIAENRTIAKLDIRENDQCLRYFKNVRDLPFEAQSAENFIKIIRYVINRKNNSSIPFMPINMVIHCADEENALKVIEDFSNVLWYFDYFWNDKEIHTEHISLAKTSLNDLINKYTEAPRGTIFALSEIEVIKKDEAVGALLTKLTKIMEEREKDIITVVRGEKHLLKEFFASYKKLYHQILSQHIFVNDMDENTLCDKVINNIGERLAISDEMKTILQNYIDANYQASELKGNQYIKNLSEKILFNHYNNDFTFSSKLEKNDIPEIIKKRSEEEIFEEINKLVGLSEVKSKLHDINDLIKYFIKTNKGMTQRPTLHMVFSGNAGTGKTTVARLMAEILYSIGFIKQNKLVICSSKDLIGQYVGQTAPKTARKCEEAYGGILFIDEAYELTPSAGNDGGYKSECVNELIQQMENNRDKLIVIFAGYKEEMERFVSTANSGLKSRISDNIFFADYSLDELTTIFENIVKQNGMVLTDEALNKARFCIKNGMSDSQHFGNARYVRSLYEHSLLRHAKNTSYSDDENVLSTLTIDDIVTPN